MRFCNHHFYRQYFSQCFPHLFAIGLVFLVVVFLAPACGKKGPPLSPIKDGNFLAVPGNIAFSLDKDQLTLTWTHTIDPVNAKLEPEAFEVYMAKKGPDACEGCPFVFESVGVVPMPDMVYLQKIAPGFLYYFRVRAIGKDKIKSDYSKTSYVDNKQ